VIQVETRSRKEMKHGKNLVGLAVIFVLLILLSPVNGQDLEPRTYSISPVGVNITLFSYSYPSGDVEFDPSLPIEDVKAKLNILTLGYFKSLNFFGRSANISGLVPIPMAP